MSEVTLESAPRKARELFEKGLGAMERGNLDYAMDMFTSVLEIEPRLLQARKFLRAAAVKKFKDAKGGAVAHVISSATGMPGMLAVTVNLRKKPMDALRAAEKLLRADPLNRKFIDLFGQAALAAELPEAAVQTLEVGRDHYPNDVPLLKKLGKLYLDLNRTQEARGCFEEFARLRPLDPEAIKALKDAEALDTMKQGGWSGAATYRDVIKDTKEATLLEQEAKAVKSTRDLGDLIRETQEKVRREPENQNYRRALADLYTRAERFDDALNLLRESQRMTGGTDPQIDRAISLTRISQFDAEIAKRKAAGDPAGAQAAEQAKDEFLLTDATDRVRRYPNDLQFRYDLGLLLYERGRLNEAIQELQLAQRNPQRRIRALYYLARCFEQKKQYDIALEQLEKASSEIHLMDDNKKDILYEMGTVCELMGQTDKAAQHFKEIYSVDIGYKDIAQKVEKAYGR
jgi:tetratricopeptide (TPR) repeat protein